jgi:3-carboxy-cis,cis-muconate cycloisomerase
MSDNWSGEAHVQGLLAFEAALARAEARAEARAGIIPAAAAEAIGCACQVADFDVPALFREAAVAGTPAIPLMRMPTERVAEDGCGYVHWGAISQDAIDTSLVLQMHGGLDFLTEGLRSIGEACATLAERHRDTPIAGRTLLQQALPIPFGLKAARWLALITRQLARMREARARVSVVQLGGAAGTLASLGAVGPRVTEMLAEELGLAVPDLPWHAERDRVAEVAAALGVVAGAMAKIAGDLVLLAQTEVDEASEAAAQGKGISSALPQKRYPVDATLVRASARLALGVVPLLLAAMELEHERAAGAWQMEWEALPALFGYTAGAVARDALAGLDVVAVRMRANLNLTRGAILAEALSMALAAKVGQQAAQEVVRKLTERAMREDIPLLRAAEQDERTRAVLSSEALVRLFDSQEYFGSAGIFIDRALAEFRALAA